MRRGEQKRSKVQKRDEQGEGGKREQEARMIDERLSTDFTSDVADVCSRSFARDGIKEHKQASEQQVMLSEQTPRVVEEPRCVENVTH
jgi:hypothetical protein